MANKKQIVMIFRCPFCTTQIWFEKAIDLEAHFKKDHERQVLSFVSSECRVKAIKENGHWRTV